MRGIAIISGGFVALCLACGGAALAGQPDEVGQVTVSDVGGLTRIAIDVPADARYDVFSLAHPDRLVVDVHHARLGEGFRVPGPDGVVANVRTGQPVPGDVRLVFEMTAKVRAKTALRQEDGRARLQVDLRDPAGRMAARQPMQAPRIDASAPAVLDGSSHGRLSVAATLTPTPAMPITRMERPTEVSLAADAESDPTYVATPPVATVTAPTPASAPVKIRLNSTRDGASASVEPSAASTPSNTPLPSASDTRMADDASRGVASRPGARTVGDVLGHRLRPIVIAVDAGHGGKDTGAQGYSGTYEKNITLAEARELAREIDAVPGMKAVLTRDGDYFVPLAERYHIAREAKADLFISIHCDAEPGHDATGSSVWVLSERGVTSQAARWLADRENASDLVGGVKLSDKDNTLASVLLNLSQSATMKASIDAAERVHQALRDIGRTHKAHPERANFVVLRSPDVPSMLVETAFITNQGEEEKLNDPRYRAKLAGAILSGVEGYFVSTPLPGTEFAALHAHGRHDRGGVASVAVDPVMNTRTADADTTPQTAPIAASVPAAPIQLATADPGPQIHIVQPGERLRDIASQYGVSLLRLRELNDLAGNQVHPGQRLRIPARSNNG
ncbi:MAG: N-acetylmuramoyl-L-alanine amidase [Proteobacteria bacterium]|nr:N-acetylmuramoyl-L-alanine amidase [Pseudomonadota bacterium]